MSEPIQAGQTYERVNGPKLTADVLRLDGHIAICRLRRGSGDAFAGERPVPMRLLHSDQFELVSASAFAEPKP